MRTLKIAFMGTPDFAVPPLRALHESAHDVVCVYSQPPRPKGRGKKEQKSPVHLYAQEQGIPVRTPVHFKSADDVQAFADLNLDLAIVAAYGLILPESILNAPRHGCINIHASLLPRWRGAAPIHRAILNGDRKTGITIMQMDKGLDTGDMISSREIAITDQTTLPALHDALASMGAEMIIDIVNELAQSGHLNKTPQPSDGVTYAHMLTKEDGKINWHHSAAEIDRQIRALNPWPGSWCFMPGGKRIKILSAHADQKGDSINNATKPIGSILDPQSIQCGNGSILSLISIQPENKKPMRLSDAINGQILSVGDQLS